jgi:hypothetical protein
MSETEDGETEDAAHNLIELAALFGDDNNDNNDTNETNIDDTIQHQNDDNGNTNNGNADDTNAPEEPQINNGEVGAVNEDIQDDWVYPRNKPTQQHHNRTFNTNQCFTKAQLLAVRPFHIRGWLCNRAYHTPNPGPNDRPIYYE